MKTHLWHTQNKRLIRRKMNSYKDCVKKCIPP